MIATFTAVSYARFSSDRQHESSIEAQHAAIAEYASRKGVSIVEQYVDRAKSGTTDKRPEFQRMLSDLKVRPVDLVLVHKTDRFARNRYDAAVYSRVIAQRGARLVAVAQDFGDGPEAVILEALMQGWAEYYSLNLATEVVKGRKVKIKTGQHPGGTYPFGYRSDGHGGYMIDEVEAYFVRKLYQAVLDGTPYARVIEEMRAAGITGRRGAVPKTSNIAAMLRSPIYAGIYQARAGEETITIEDNHPAIIPKATYEEALHIMDQKLNVGRAGRRKYLCTGIVFCAACHSPMYGHSQTKGNKTYCSYICEKHCGGVRSIPADELDRAACAYVNALLAPQVREQLTDALATYMAGQRKAARSRAPQARRDIASLRKQIDAITQNIASGVLPVSVLQRLGEQVTELEGQIEVLETLASEPPQVDIGSIAAYFETASDVTPDGDFSVVQRTLHHFIASITVHPTHIEFSCTFDAWLREHCPQLAPSSIAPLPPEDDDPDTTPPSTGGSNGASSSTPSAPVSPVPQGSASFCQKNMGLAEKSSTKPMFPLQAAVVNALHLDTDLFIQAAQYFVARHVARTARRVSVLIRVKAHGARLLGQVFL